MASHCPTGNNVHVTCMFHTYFINLHAQQNMHVTTLVFCTVEIHHITMATGVSVGMWDHIMHSYIMHAYNMQACQVRNI